ncbi:MAG: hypothetical protein ABFD84_16960 [Candidatus Polarisedimenticolia bacterium]|nr:hypothetical protein [bacterium]
MMTGTVLLGADMPQASLPELLASARVPADAWVLCEGDDGVVCSAAGGVDRSAMAVWPQGRVFWDAGELRWRALGTGTVRVVFLGEAAEVVSLPQLGAARELRETEMRRRPVVLRGIDGIDFRAGEEPSDGALAKASLVEYVTADGDVAFARLAGISARG